MIFSSLSFFKLFLLALLLFEKKSKASPEKQIAPFGGVLDGGGGINIHPKLCILQTFSSFLATFE